MRELVNTFPLFFLVFLLLKAHNSSLLVAGSNVSMKYQEFHLVPGSVHDGDTIRVKKDNQVLKIRFACIDAPELKQPFGIESRDRLREILKGKELRLNIITTDRYGRSVAEVYAGSELVQSLQASMGLVWPYEAYKKDCPSWESVLRASKYAQEKKLGIFSKPGLEPPWQFRKR